MWDPGDTFLEEKKGKVILVTEFAFEGGYRGGPSAMDHIRERQEGMPRANAELTSMPVEGSPAWTSWTSTFAIVHRMDSHGLSNAGTGYMGELQSHVMDDIFCVGILPIGDREQAIAEVVKKLKDRWGGGRYRVTQTRGGLHHEDTFVVPGPSLTLGVLGGAQDGTVTLTPGDGGLAIENMTVRVMPELITVNATVWLELSRGGPFKVVAKYEHPAGATLEAHRQNDAPNTFERVQMTEDLWLCQDAKGVVHILAGGSLTTSPPASRFGKVNQVAAWCWGKRELVLWASIVGMAAALAY